jgi:hypothetical protein
MRGCQGPSTARPGAHEPCARKCRVASVGMTAPENAPPKVRGRYMNQIQRKDAAWRPGRAEAAPLQLSRKTFCFLVQPGAQRVARLDRKEELPSTVVLGNSGFE